MAWTRTNSKLFDLFLVLVFMHPLRRTVRVPFLSRPGQVRKVSHRVESVPPGATPRSERPVADQLPLSLWYQLILHQSNFVERFKLLLPCRHGTARNIFSKVSRKNVTSLYNACSGSYAYTYYKGTCAGNVICMCCWTGRSEVRERRRTTLSLNHQWQPCELGLGSCTLQ